MILPLNRKKVFFLLVVLELFLQSHLVLAIGTSPTTQQQPLEYPSAASLFFRIFISLIFILILTYVVMKLLKKQNNLQQRQKSWIRVYDYQGLGTSRGIYLLEILGNVYVIGASEGQINILKEIDENDDYWHDIKDSLEQNQEELLPWGLEKVIKESLGKFKPKSYTPDNTFEKQLDEQLSRSERLYRKISHGGKEDE